MDEFFMDPSTDNDVWSSRRTFLDGNKLGQSFSKFHSIPSGFGQLPEHLNNQRRSCSSSRFMGNLTSKPLKPVQTSSEGVLMNENECVVISDSQPSLTTSSQHSTSGCENTGVSLRRSRANLTLEKYRSYMGINTLKPIHTRRPVEDQFNFMDEWTVCNHCRFAQNEQLTRCRRCGRKIDAVMPTEGLSERPSLSESQLPSAGISGHSFYRQSSGESVKPVVVPVRSVRVKRTEPQCVTLSSDEEEDEPEVKRAKDDSTRTCIEKKLPSSQTSSVEELPQSEEFVDESNLQVDRWKEAGFEGSFVALYCHCIRIGSYQTVPKERVLMCKEGIKLMLPVYNENQSELVEETASLFVTVSDILHMKIYLGNDLPSFFVLVSPKCAGLLRIALNLKERTGPYISPQSSEDYHRYITILPNAVNEESKFLIRNLFPTLLEEVSLESAMEMLIRMAPPWVHEVPRPPGQEVAEESKEEEETTLEEKTEKSDKKHRQEVRRRLPEVCELFRWLEEFVVTTEDYLCLNRGEFLNDNVIEFYIRYLCRTLLSEEDQQKYHVFSSFFYNKLNTKPKNEAGGSEMSAAERRHQRVKSWTKKVNLFEKDFIIVPINQNFHWFLAIICFPGQDGPRRMRDDQPVAPRKESRPQRRRALSKVDSSTWRILKMDWSLDDFDVPGEDVEQADTRNEDVQLEEVVTLDDDEPIKQPCILIMDSLAGDSHTRVIHTLREYLMIEYREKYGDAASAHRLFNKTAMPGTCLQVAQQPNFSDCGVYVLQYVESFLTDPIKDYRFPLRDYRGWFPESRVRGKRAHIQQLLLNLMEEINPGQESLRATLLQVTLQEPPTPDENRDSNRQSARSTAAGEPSTQEKSSGPEIMDDEEDGRLSPVLIGNRSGKAITTTSRKQ